MAVPQPNYSRIARKVQAPLPAGTTPWTPPALTDLIARIDAALLSRRAS